MMSAALKAMNITSYVSDRVYDGVRKVTDRSKIEQMNARVEMALAKIEARAKPDGCGA